MEATLDTTAVQELAERYGEAWNARDVDTILSLHTDDSVFQLHVAGAGEVVGKAAIRETFAGFIAQFPDLHFAGVRLQVGESHWAGEAKMSGTAASPLAIDGQALEAEGARLEIDCVDVIAVRDGLIARKDTYLDAAALMRATGAA
jgi:steroid delta-isomerase-like uncharacterized protein